MELFNLVGFKGDPSPGDVWAFQRRLGVWGLGSGVPGLEFRGLGP